MRVVVTGSRGKVGTATVAALAEAGHDVLGTDLMPPTFERMPEGAPEYMQADFNDSGSAYAAVRGADAVVHVGAIPEPTRHPAHVVFQNNVMATFNAVEASIRMGVKRFVNISSETVPGFFFAERPFLPDYLPVDEEHPVRPQDPYAFGKQVGELMMDAAARRSDIRAISIRPCWVQWEGNYERNLGPLIRDTSEVPPGLWSYIDVYDLADSIRLATESDLPGHEVFYIASPDNVPNRNFAEAIRQHFGDKIELRSFEREDASYISCRKANDMLGYKPSRTWRDYLDEQGHLLPEVRERLASRS